MGLSTHLPAPRQVSSVLLPALRRARRTPRALGGGRRDRPGL